MKILITGAAGSLGRRLVEKLIQDESVTVFATDIKESPFGFIANLDYQCFDLRDPAFIDWVEQIAPDQIVHLASVLQISATLTREMAYEIDVVATKNLLQSSIKTGVKKFIITTSGAAYGYYPENKDIITESRPTRGNTDYFYSAHKAEIETLMAEYRELHPELQQIVFRPGAILGPNFEGPVVNLFRQNILTGLLGYPGPFNFIWSEDVVNFIVEGLRTDITGQFNMAGDGIMTMKQIAQRLDKFYIALPELLIKTILSIAKPLGLTQYGPEQTKFIKYRPVLDNTKLKTTFNYQPQYSTSEALDAFLNQHQSAPKAQNQEQQQEEKA